MRVFRNKWFAKFARKEGIEDSQLIQAVRNAMNGNIDADYGGGLIKQRIARKNEGKSGGYRSIILFRYGDKAFFVYAFPKNAKSNLDEREEREYKVFAKLVLKHDDNELQLLINKGVWQEIKCDD